MGRGWVVRLRCLWRGAFLWDSLRILRWIGVAGLAASFSPRVGFLVAFLKDDASDALKFGTYAKHTLDCALFFGDGKEGEKVHDLVH